MPRLRQFRENFEGGLEPEGAAFAVYHKGELVVDLWGGYADSEAVIEWQRNTISLFFSVTKVRTYVGTHTHARISCFVYLGGRRSVPADADG